MRKKMWIALILCMCMFVVPSMGAWAAESDIIANDESGIPDKVLYKEILNALGKKAGETFTRQEAESLEELDVRSSVKTLKGIGNLSQLEKLCVMSQYCLKSLEGVESLHELEELDVSYNKIQSLKSLENLTNLEYLTVDFNQLTSLEGVENLKKLKGLSAGWNKITSLKPLKGLTNLEYLWMNGNQLKNLKGIEKATGLIWLLAEGNRLTSIKEIKGLKNMEKLDVSYNRLTSVNEIKGMKKLKTLNISANRIKKLPNMKSFKKLDYLFCDVYYNRLTEKEIRKKLPDRFFKKSKEKKEWLGEQVDFQNLNYEVTLIEPANTKKITKNTKRIVGRTMKNAYVELDCSSKGWKLKRVKADESGKFVMDNLDLRKWAGKTARFKISIRRSNGKIAGIKSDTEFKVKK